MSGSGSGYPAPAPGIFTNTMKGGFWPMWIVTTILTYGHKIPIIGRVIKILQFWYGRTTWWKILITARKFFIVFNAIIGVLTVFKISGFSSDNLIAGLYCVGYSYFDMLTSFIKRLFTWFLNKLDLDIIPAIPSGSKPSGPGSSGPRWWWPFGGGQAEIASASSSWVGGPKQQTWHTSPMNDNGI